MPGAYWIAHVTVTDEEAYAKYAVLAGKAIAEHGGRFLARGGAAIQKEGRAHPRNVVAHFPSLEAANACYESATYKEALSHAKGASERDLVLVEAIE
ncbi:DUF1330 domain-containing protein [Roseibacterium sp. SDUM158016]|jgi:uncharacterized protein (DUF1330 family)|uniref:DUF1330 domain-containing protein n=1 Tax=Roseicyclus sediminis TaxID=2980997 RepID=UPI0021D085FE|nr:DUF1330 domain-containing protein [Roseibacterium sp. SDUM158016]MCU4655205.1 DUF1330 domain-containing protein [Roseibacterium sp. SDUM158016]